MRLASLLDRLDGREKAASGVLTLRAMSRLVIAVEHSLRKSEKSAIIRIEDVCLSFDGVNADGCLAGVLTQRLWAASSHKTTGPFTIMQLLAGQKRE
jgi:hypothetical protein